MTSPCAARDDANYLVDTESYESIYMPKVARIPAHSDAGNSQESQHAPFAGVSSQTDRHHDIEHHDEDELAHHEHGPGEAADPEVSAECAERLRKLEHANVQLPMNGSSSEGLETPSHCLLAALCTLSPSLDTPCSQRLPC
jgi:hypothetical protein